MGALDNTLGAFLLGFVAAAMLYGVTCVQTWYYFTRYISDPWRLKLLVSAVFFADTLHQALIIHIAYTFLVTGFGTLPTMKKNLWSLIIALLVTGLTAVMVQCFLISRIYRLSKKNRMVTGGFVLSLVVGEFVLHFAYTVKAFSKFGQPTDLENLAIGINAIAVVIDVVIAAFLCTLLRQARTGFRRTNTMIKKLILFSINTGLLTSICATLALISVIIWPAYFISIAFYLCIGRFYCNSLLVTLNARSVIRGDSGDDAMDISLSLQGTSNAVTVSSHRKDISIKIDTQREYVSDEYSVARDLKSVQGV